VGGRIGGVQQKGLPASAINGKDMQDANDKSIPQDVQEKLLCEGGTCRLSYESKSLSFNRLGFHGHRRVSNSRVHFSELSGMRNEYVAMR
jgi:L-fucose isomerase